MGAEREEVKKGGQRDRQSHESWPKTSDVINTTKETHSTRLPLSSSHCHLHVTTPN